MAADVPRPIDRRARTRLFWLSGALTGVAAIYLCLPRSWFEVSEKPVSPVPAAVTAPAAPASLDVMRSAAAKAPLDFTARSRYGMALSAAQRNAEALAEFRAAASLAPESPAVHHNLGVFYLNNGRPAEADTEFCRELEIIPGIGSVHYFRGLALQAEHKNTEAAAQFRLAIDLAPDVPEPYLALAAQRGDKQPIDQTRSLVQNYLRLGGSQNVANFVLSRACRAQQLYVEAAQYAELTVKESPNSYAYWHNLGQIYSYARRFQDADRALLRALGLAHDKSTVYIELGMNAQNAGRLADAIAAFKNALESNPGTGNVHIYLARAYQRQGDQESAKREEAAFRRWNREHGSGRRGAHTTTK